MDAIQKNLLEQVAGLHEIPEGAYNIRSDGQLAGRNTTANIDIISKQDKSGIDIYIKPGTTNESVHIPVILSQSGLQELVYNDFHVGELRCYHYCRSWYPTTVELILQSMTVYTPSMLEKIPKSATSKDTMEKAMDAVRTL